MKMPEKVRLSVDVIRYLKSVTDGNPRRVKDLAVILNTSQNFLHQVVSLLSRNGMVSVIKGPKGGISSNLSEVTLLQVYQLFGYMDEPIEGSLPHCEIEKEMRKFLDSVVI